jgi:hypothetical protein
MKELIEAADRVVKKWECYASGTNITVLDEDLANLRNLLKRRDRLIEIKNDIVALRNKLRDFPLNLTSTSLTDLIDNIDTILAGEK